MDRFLQQRNSHANRHAIFYLCTRVGALSVHLLVTAAVFDSTATNRPIGDYPAYCTCTHMYTCTPIHMGPISCRCI